jgi:RHH-type proline utilization regulon transcriptional repressor/proline dehydrogenase/delta 1-pyrroline-5-carboxylate dehydrogenase
MTMNTQHTTQNTQPHTEHFVTELEAAEAAIRAAHVADQAIVIRQLMDEAELTEEQRANIQARAVDLIGHIRNSGEPGLMDQFLAEYGLSTNEGIALMCLAEALLRVPDAATIDALIDDKITPYNWSEHFGDSSSALVNASTVALMLTGSVLDDDNTSSVSGLLHRTVKRLGSPVVRVAVRRAMKEMGNQFVLGQTIEQAIKRGRAEMRQGFQYSYDMLGEGALTMADADAYYEAYSNAIKVIGKSGKTGPVAERPGISVKLSALHPRFEFAKAERLQQELVPRLLTLALLAKDNGMGLNIDAEEANRLEASLPILQQTLSDERLHGWDGFGVVIQAYGKRAAPMIDWLYTLATQLDRKIMVRLVKGAYWDSEIKHAQVEGDPDFPVFTRRAATDVSYICCAKKLLGMTDRIYPQFATHNAQTAAAILELAQDGQPYEFQRLHGMGETLHNYLRHQEGVTCRIYAPVGPHKDLLAYLVRRLLENGANSSFVNQINDLSLPAQTLAADPMDRVALLGARPPRGLKSPGEIYAPSREAAAGWDLASSEIMSAVDAERDPFRSSQWHSTPITVTPFTGDQVQTVINPCDPTDIVGSVIFANSADAVAAAEQARTWSDASGEDRAKYLRHAANLFEADFGEMFALLHREAGKTLGDAVAELREAIDFLRYYANQAEILASSEPLGIVTCIAPWNFPLAIFTGQIAAALAAGNGVLAKPAESTSLIADKAVSLLHHAGVPLEVLQCLPGTGVEVGTALASHELTAGLCFTGSTNTARLINRAMAENVSPFAPLIAETGGLNAAIIDSTALPEQAVRATIASAFQSAGQRCSALRMLYIQEDVAPGFLAMLFGAMEELALGNTWNLATDVGPLISADAQTQVQDYINKARDQGRLLKQMPAPEQGHFVGPAVIEVTGIGDLEQEIFGPVLHIARFKAENYDATLEAINATGYGLTFGLHTRIDERVKDISGQLRTGNIYVNRNQVGAVVETQPFGGEGLSGTGPKAGGPRYVQRFTKPYRYLDDLPAAKLVSLADAQRAIDEVHYPVPEALVIQDMPGPTGESNRLAVWPRGLVLCLGPSLEEARAQAGAARRVGCPAVVITAGVEGPGCIDGQLERSALAELQGIEVVALNSPDDDLRLARLALASRPGKIIPLVAGDNLEQYCVVERHTCIDTTAAGGNATLLTATEDESS